ncbi:MAG TPA: hypothetical protein VGG27_08920 [Magnetospirillaceae bacterium]
MAETEDRIVKTRAALQDLERSLARLDRAIAGRKGEAALTDDLAAARAEYDRLAATTRAVEARLTGVRERLQAALVG